MFSGDCHEDRQLLALKKAQVPLIPQLNSPMAVKCLAVVLESCEGTYYTLILIFSYN